MSTTKMAWMARYKTPLSTTITMTAREARSVYRKVFIELSFDGVIFQMPRRMIPVAMMFVHRGRTYPAIWRGINAAGGSLSGERDKAMWATMVMHPKIKVQW